MTEIAAQRESSGILYEPYHNDFKTCIYQEPNVQGRNEKYEFRCDAHLECCGRVCCIPEAVGIIPLWLLILLALLGLLLLLALLSLIYYLCCRKKKKLIEPKKINRSDLYRGNANGYRSIKHADDADAFNKYRRHGNSGSYDDLAHHPTHGHVYGHGYGNRGFDKNHHVTLNAPSKIVNIAAQRYSPRPPSFHEEETFEESFKEEIEIERAGKPSSLSSQESLILNNGKFR